MARITPRIYAEGRYELASPWAAVMPPSTVFVCEAIRSFPEIEQDGTDVYETFYQDFGLDLATFQSDVKEDACIITLVSQDRQHIIFVPDTYILYAPTGENVKCDQIVLSVNLGVLPAYKDLTSVKAALETKLTEILGVTETFEENRIPTVKTISQTDNDIAEAARDALIVFQESPAATIRRLEQTIVQLQDSLNSAYDKLLAEGFITTV